MAHLGNAFECDVCKAVKKPNLEEKGWLIGVPELPLVIAKWSETLAMFGHTYNHLCGIECAQKWVGQQLSAVQS